MLAKGVSSLQNTVRSKHVFVKCEVQIYICTSIRNWRVTFLLVLYTHLFYNRRESSPVLPLTFLFTPQSLKIVALVSSWNKETVVVFLCSYLICRFINRYFCNT